MFASETARKLKKPPAQNVAMGKAELAFVFPLRLDDMPREVQQADELALQGKGDTVSQMWRF